MNPRFGAILMSILSSLGLVTRGVGGDLTLSGWSRRVASKRRDCRLAGGRGRPREKPGSYDTTFEPRANRRRWHGETRAARAVGTSASPLEVRLLT